MLAPRCTTVSAAVSSPLTPAAMRERESDRERDREPYTYELIRTHKVPLCCSETCVHSPPYCHIHAHRSYFSLSATHTQIHLYLNFQARVGCTFSSLTSWTVTECWSELTFAVQYAACVLLMTLSAGLVNRVQISNTNYDFKWNNKSSKCTESEEAFGFRNTTIPGIINIINIKKHTSLVFSFISGDTWW